MIVYPKIDELLTKVDSKFTLVIESAKRARQINNYFNALKRGELIPIRGPQVETSSRNPLTIALTEIVEEKVEYDRVLDSIK